MIFVFIAFFVVYTSVTKACRVFLLLFFLCFYLFKDHFEIIFSLVVLLDYSVSAFLSWKFYHQPVWVITWYWLLFTYVQIFFIINSFRCPKNNFWPLTRRQSHSPDVHSCAISNLTQWRWDPHNEVGSQNLSPASVGFKTLMQYPTMLFLLLYLPPKSLRKPWKHLSNINPRGFYVIL